MLLKNLTIQLVILKRNKIISNFFFEIFTCNNDSKNHICHRLSCISLIFTYTTNASPISGRSPGQVVVCDFPPFISNNNVTGRIVYIELSAELLER